MSSVEITPKDTRLPITAEGAAILKANQDIPQLARIALDKYANGKVKALKLVTKAFKYVFPFYEISNRKKAYNKLFSLLNANIKRKIPYISTAKVDFIDLININSDTINIRIGPFRSGQESYAPIDRYIQKLLRVIRQYNVPLLLSYRLQTYTAPNKRSRTEAWTSQEEAAVNTFEVCVISIKANEQTADRGYILLHYYPYIEKVFNTLHRLAHFNESTIRRT